MTDNSSQLVKLSRRKVLAGLGAVGIASAGAGLGTSAYFSDRELLGSNEFVTGELDLLVDWQQHYTMDGETTFVNAHPDHDGDGEQSIVVDGEAVTYSDFVDSEDPTGTGRNIPLLDCETVPPLSEAAFGVDPTTGDPQEALIQLGDVKPGDTGEVTFSLHLCDNPGYVWMQADNISESEGIDTQPELAVDETTGADLARNIEAKLWYDTDCDNVHDTNGASDIMLVIDFSGSMLYRQFGGVVSEDPITPNGQTYDETTKIDLVELGAREFVQYLIDQGADAQVGVAYFDGEGSDDTVPRTGILQPLTTNLTAVDTAVSNLRQKLANVVTGGPGSTPFDGDGDPDPDTGGSGITTGTYIGEGLDDAQSQLATNGRSGVPASSIVLSDGESFNGTGSTQFVSPQDAAADARAGAPAPETNVYTVSVGSANDSVLQAMAGPAGGAGNSPQFFYDVDDPTAIPTVFGVLAGQFVGEKIIIEDSLATVLGELSSGNGIPLDGNVLTLYDELNEPATDPNRDAFEGNGLMYCIGLSWELPFAVGNEAQGDTVAFDVGFYTEQERNNDGSGPSVPA